MKPCPYCEKKIQNTAIVCRYCGKELTEVEPPQNKEKNKLPKKKILLSLGITLGVLILAAGAWWLFRPLTLQITEISNSALVRPSAGAEFVQAQAGQVLENGAEVLTSEPEGATLEFSDGTILRLAQNTYIIITQLNSSLSTHINLLSGKVWVILKSRELQVDTDLGTSVVSGSYMSVQMNSINQIMETTCLEGNCSLQNDMDSTNLTDGQVAFIENPDTKPSDAQSMENAQYVEWVKANPEATAIVGKMGIDDEQIAAASELSSDTASSIKCEEYANSYNPHPKCFVLTFENNCLGRPGKLPRTNWHWTFHYGLDVYSYSGNFSGWMFFTINNGQAITILLPVGRYDIISDYTDEGSINHVWMSQSLSDFIEYDEDTDIFVNLCPDDPSLTGSNRTSNPDFPPDSGVPAP